MGTSLGPERKIARLPLFDRIGWDPHSAQRRVFNAPNRNKVVSAGRRFGKSQLGGYELVAECLDTRLVSTGLKERNLRREFWVVGPSYTDSEKEFRVLWNTLSSMGLKDYFDRPGSYNDPVGGSMHLSLWDGTFQVHAKSEKHPDSLVGEGLSGVIFAEAAKLKERTYNKLIRPTLADFNGWSLFTSTPEGKNWFYDLWRRGQDPGRPEWWSMRAPSWFNHYVYSIGATDAAIEALRLRLAAGEGATHELYAELAIDPEIGDLVADLTPEAFNQEIGADFTEFVGRVFKEFDEEVHVTDLKFDPSWTTYAAVDYGFRNPNVWLLLQVDPFGEQINVLDEIYEEGLDANEFADLIQARGLAPGGLQTFYPDPASPGDTAILEEQLRVKHSGHTGGELRWRLNAISHALKPYLADRPADFPGNRPALMFDRKCVRTINDFSEYRYPEKKVDKPGENAELPMKKDDHGPEALGRFFAGRFGTPDKQARRARVRKVTMRR